MATPCHVRTNVIAVFVGTEAQSKVFHHSFIPVGPTFTALLAELARFTSSRIVRPSIIHQDRRRDWRLRGANTRLEATRQAQVHDSGTTATEAERPIFQLRQT